METGSSCWKYPKGLINLPADSEQVTDADEEIFLLYTALQGHWSSATSPPDRKGFHGLGHVDSRRDTLTITLEPDTPAELEVHVAQDKTALRSRKGDTGSVLWRVSTRLAQVILQQRSSHNPDALLDPVRLADAHVLELGAGTGLMSAALSPLVRKYTATDMTDLLPLIRKTLALNASSRRPLDNVTVSALDWTLLHATPAALRPHVFAAPRGALFDLVLVVDCVYNPALLPALLDTIEYVTPRASAGDRAPVPVLVVVELRAEDVLREFLERWIAGGVWRVWRVGGEVGPLGMPYVAWVGWRVGADVPTNDPSREQ